MRNVRQVIDPFEHIPEEGKRKLPAERRIGRMIDASIETQKGIVTPMSTATRERVKATLKEGETSVHKPARLKDFTPSGTFIPMADIEGQDVLVWAINDITTKFGPALSIVWTNPDEEMSADAVRQTITSGAALVPALNAVRQQVNEGTVKFPLLASFVKAKNQEGQEYWSIE
jgi:hypothetical protein